MEWRPTNQDHEEALVLLRAHGWDSCLDAAVGYSAWWDGKGIPSVARLAGDFDAFAGRGADARRGVLDPGLTALVGRLTPVQLEIGEMPRREAQVRVLDRSTPAPLPDPRAPYVGERTKDAPPLEDPIVATGWKEILPILAGRIGRQVSEREGRRQLAAAEIKLKGRPVILRQSHLDAISPPDGQVAGRGSRI
jgi:hypothetical protein